MLISVNTNSGFRWTAGDSFIRIEKSNSVRFKKPMGQNGNNVVCIIHVLILGNLIHGNMVSSMCKEYSLVCTWASAHSVTCSLQVPLGKTTYCSVWNGEVGKVTEDGIIV